MAHAQKPDFVFRRNGRVHLNRRGRQFSRLLAAEVCVSAVIMMDTPCSEVAWRVLVTHCIRQFPPSLPLSCVTVCHHISTGLYYIFQYLKTRLSAIYLLVSYDSPNEQRLFCWAAPTGWPPLRRLTVFSMRYELDFTILFYFSPPNATTCSYELFLVSLLVVAIV